MFEREKTDHNNVRNFAWVPDAYGPEGRYKWISRLSVGGQGYTELCADTWSGGLVVVKGEWWRECDLEPAIAAATRDVREAQFEESFKIQLELSHRTQSVPSVVDVVSQVSPTRERYQKLVPPGVSARADINHESFLVMQFVGDPGNASQTLEQLVAAEGPMDSAQAVSLADQLAAGLEAMHVRRGKGADVRYWAHSDVKPANILVSGRPRRFTLIDHGAAREVRPRSGRVTEVNASTPFYSPPHDEPLTEKFDTYSLAATLVFALTQELPRTESGSGKARVQEIAKDLAKREVHPALVRLITSCLPDEAEFRLTARSFRRELAAVNAFAVTEVLSR